MVTRYPEVRQKLPEELRRPPVYSLLMTAILHEILPLFLEHLTKIEEEMSPAGTQEPRSTDEGFLYFSG